MNAKNKIKMIFLAQFLAFQKPKFTFGEIKKRKLGAVVWKVGIQVRFPYLRNQVVSNFMALK